MLADNPQRLSYGIAEAVEVTCVGRSLIYMEIKAGNLKTFKVGSRTLIAAQDLHAWLDAHKEASK